MSTLQELQFPIDQAIFGEVLNCLPDDWKKARFVASQKVTSQGTSMSVRIDALAQPGIAIVSDELQARARELFILNAQFQTALKSFSYSYEKQPDGRWSFAGEYEYV